MKEAGLITLGWCIGMVIWLWWSGVRERRRWERWEELSRRRGPPP